MKSMEISDSPFNVENSHNSFAGNIRALLRKNFLLLLRNKTGTLIQLMSPIFVCLYLFAAQEVVNTFVDSTADASSPVFDSKIPHCIGEDCVSLQIVLSGEPTDWTDFVIPHISEQSGFTIGKDIQVVQQSPLAFMHYLSENQNKTQVALILCTSEIDLDDNYLIDSIPCEAYESTSYYYSIVFNYTTILYQGYNDLKPHYFSNAAIGVKTAIDNAILAYEQSRHSEEYVSTYIEMSYSGYPSTKNRYMDNFNIGTNQGTRFYFIPPMILFGMILSEVTREKEEKLRSGLIVNGVSNKEYWASWFIVAFCLVFITSNVQIFAGYFFDLIFFVRTPYLILLMTFVSFGMAMMMVGFFLATLLPTAKSAYTTSYAFLLGGFVFQACFAEIHIMKVLYSQELASWSRWVIGIFSLYPPYMFGVIAECINSSSGYDFDKHTMHWEKRPGYTWHHFFHNNSGEFEGFNYSIPCGSIVLTTIFFDSLMFAFLAWYCDHVVQSNRGRKDSLYFLLTRKYWRQYFHKTDTNLVSDSEGLELNGLRKTFSKGILKKSCKHAVLPTYLSVTKNNLLVLIGHNGAGKTTLVNMLTGLLSPSSGTASINGFDLINDFSHISKMMGYCPQKDTLWNELTVQEHLKLFCRFKSVSSIEYTTQKTLKQIGLENEANVIVKHLSGGMKRRLSVGIASLGNPKIVFLDEPTTGMDPVCKKEVWRLIQDLKQDRVVVLTTHSMEEADILSDVVAVMIDGSIETTGTSLSLKNEYGEGYKISILSPVAQECWNRLQMTFSHLNLVDISAGSLIISLSKDFPKETETLLEDLEGNKFGKLVEEWTLSNSSLEEVFIKLTDKKTNNH